MKTSLILLPFLASAAFGQEDLWKTLAKGDRIQVTFRSGNMISGQLDAKPGDPRVKVGAIDYTQVSEITLDVSLEYPGLNGTMTIPKKEIKEIRKLQNMDPATMKRIQEEVQRIQKQAATDEAARRSSEVDRDKAAKKAQEDQEKLDAKVKGNMEKGKDLLKEAEDLKKGLALLDKYPPDKYGPQTAKDIADKALRKQPITPDEVAFTDPETQRLWNLALQWQKSQSKEAPGAPNQ